MYVRKIWYEVATETDGLMKIYFERQARRGRGLFLLFDNDCAQIVPAKVKYFQMVPNENKG
jgi:hypothetical protein